jgi:TRAP-type C4-dicarboxylate transport system substrate-binding protein
MAGCSSGDDVDLTDLRWGTPTPEGTALSNWTDYTIENLEEKSDNEIQFEVFHGAELGSAPEQVEAVNQGTQDLYSTGYQIWGAQAGVPALQAAMMPYQYRDYENRYSDLFWDPPQPLIDMRDQLAEETDVNIVPGGGGALGLRTPSANEALTTVDDYVGKTMRAAEAPMWHTLVRGMGATPIEIAVEELPTALATGAVDIQELPLEFQGLTEMYENHDYLMMSHHIYEHGVGGIHSGTWEAMSDEQQNLFEESAREASKQQLDELQNEVEPQVLDKIRDDGVTIVEDINHDEFEQSILDQTREELPDIASTIEDIKEASDKI